MPSPSMTEYSASHPPKTTDDDSAQGTLEVVEVEEDDDLQAKVIQVPHDDKHEIMHDDKHEAK